MQNHESIVFVYSSDEFAIVDKPSGLTCHNSDDSLLSRLEGEYHLVNRLDKETSGLVVVTRHAHLQNRLQEAMRDGTKEYVTILRGKIPTSPHWQIWNSPISDAGESRDNPQGPVAERVAAETRYRCVRGNDYFSLVHCQLGTGRQHQIRKHAAMAGRPIVGDPRYGSPKDNERIKKIYGFSRLALHAHRLELTWSSQKITVESKTPAEFLALLETPPAR